MGVLGNEWLLSRILSPDGSIDDPSDLFLIRVFQTVCLVWGATNLVQYRTTLIAKLNLLFVTLLLASPLLCEVAIRGGIAAGAPGFRRPSLYFDPLSDDNFWKLRFLWSPAAAEKKPFTVKVVYDELLGWAPEQNDDNPLGIVREGAYRVETDGSVLFYGDSFVEGNTPEPDRIPQSLDRLITDRVVYNYGVSGYGVDQIYLRLRETHDQFQRPIVLVGLLTSDLDRSVLSFRDRPKPRFDIDGNALRLEGVPIARSNAEFVETHPPRVLSYFWSFLQTRYRLHRPGSWREDRVKQAEKVAVNRAILTEMVGLCRQRQTAVHVVVFYDPQELNYAGWREQFLLRELDQLGADVIDTKPILQRAAQRNGVEAASYYQSDHHLNADGNRIVAEAIARRITPQTEE